MEIPSTYQLSASLQVHKVQETHLEGTAFATDIAGMYDSYHISIRAPLPLTSPPPQLSVYDVHPCETKTHIMLMLSAYLLVTYLDEL
jgi:hypothetical protein